MEAMELKTKNWSPFVLGNLFEIKKGKRLTKENYIDGSIPFIGSTESNNGITAYVGNDEYIHPSNVITVTYNGSIAESFYQTKPFWASDDVNVLYPKFKIDSYVALFLCTVINKEKYRFNYGRKWFAERMLHSVIKLPSKNKEPDWDFIEKYVKTTLIPALPSAAKAVWTNQFEPKPLQQSDLKINPIRWKKFRYDEVFVIKNGYYNKKPDHTEVGQIPFIGATEFNNGVTEYYSITDIQDNNKDERSQEHSLDQKIFKGNCVTVTNNGSVGCAFYQEKDFTCSHDVNVLLLKGHSWTKYTAMFFCTIIELEKFRWTFGRKWRPARMPDSEIRLPVKKNGQLDFDYMENYIKSLSYSASI